ncbi:MAG TPA: helix-turn-helix domain-containing protein [Gaiellaceae bacterium]|nr:helix-turn-helix domain-containing protein [Gaiellaceae bacterium]
MSKRSYDQYCPVAHALDLIGERWAMLVVKELMHGPQRYTDLAEHLPGIGTNILAARLRSLEECGVIAKRTLPPPAASRVYELTDYGRQLKPVMRELALWGARSLGPPMDKDELFDGWLANAIDTMLGPFATKGTFEFRVGDEVAHVEDGVGSPGPAEDPDVVVETDPAGLFSLLIELRLEGVEVQGDRTLLERLIRAAARERVPAPADGALTN